MKKLAYILGVSLALVGCGAPADPLPGGEPAPAAPSPAAAAAVMMTSLSIVAPSTAVHGTNPALAAYAIDPDGNRSDMTAMVSWSSSNLLVAAVVDNKLYTIGAGTATLTARLGDVTASTDVTIVPKQIVDLTLQPDAESASMGCVRYWSLLAHYNDDSVVDVTADAGWSSSDPTIATVDQTGQITALQIGMATIMAGYGGQMAAAPFMVLNPAPGK